MSREYALLLSLGLALTGGCGASVVLDQPEASASDCAAAETLSLADSQAYFPYHDGNHWLLQGRDTRNPNLAYYDVDLSVSGPPSALVLHDDDRAVPSPVSSADHHLQLDDSGVRNLDGAPRVGSAYHEVLFPLHICSRFVAYDVPAGHGDLDFDGDGKPDPAHDRAVVTVAAREPVTTADGTVLPDAIRVERSLESSLTSTARHQTSTTTQTIVEWYARGIGLVRRTYDFGQGVAVDESALGVHVDGAAHGLQPLGTILGDLAQADSDETTPGAAAVAFDGARFLVVEAKQDRTTGKSPLLGTFVALDGTPGETVTLADNVWLRRRRHVVFDGSAYVVVFTDDSNLVAERVTPAGAIADRVAIDGPGGDPGVALGGDRLLVVWSRFVGPAYDNNELAGVTLPIGSGAPSPRFTVAARNAAAPAAAFDGSRFLVVWSEAVPTSNIDNLDNTDVYAVRMTPTGQPLDASPIPVATTMEPEADPDVGFDGASFLVAWFHSTVSNFVDYGDIRVARIAGDGSLSDGGSGRVVSLGDYTAHPRVLAIDGTTVVAYEAPYSGLGGVWAARLRPDGVDSRWLMVDHDVRHPALATAPDRTLVVALDLGTDVSQRKTLRATMLRGW